MSKYKLHILISAAIFETLFLLLLIYVFFLQGKLQESPKEGLLKCNTLKFSNVGAINLLFFAPQAKAEEYFEFFSQTQPYKTYKDRFNVYYIDNYSPKCELYRGIAVLCKPSRDLKKRAASCPNDYTIVISDNFESAIRSSTYLDVLSINSKHPMTVLTHEFAHLFSLADEYVPAGALPSGQKNCVISCPDFNGLNEGCFEGCTNAEHKRSVENGLMRTLSTDSYGNFNEILISQSILEQSSSLVEPLITGRQIGRTSSGNCVLITIDSSGATAREKILGNCDDKNKPINPGIIYTDAPVEKIEFGQPEIVGGVIEVAPEEIGFDIAVPIEEGAQTVQIEIAGKGETKKIEVDITTIQEQIQITRESGKIETAVTSIQNAVSDFFSKDAGVSEAPQDADASDAAQEDASDSITTNIIRELSEEDTFSRFALVISLILIVIFTILILRSKKH